jgi:predicted nucleic acid-binding protein
LLRRSRPNGRANVVAKWFVPERLSEEATEVALASGRSVYDSVYVALAVALQCRLVTADERLANALAGGLLAAHVVWLGRPEA